MIITENWQNQFDRHIYINGYEWPLISVYVKQKKKRFSDFLILFYFHLFDFI